MRDTLVHEIGHSFGNTRWGRGGYRKVFRQAVRRAYGCEARTWSDLCQVMRAAGDTYDRDHHRNGGIA